MASGFYCAETLLPALEKGDFSANVLKVYDQKIKESFIARELYTYRNLRQSFNKGLLRGLLRAGLITLTRGAWPPDFKSESLKSDRHVKKRVKNLSYSSEGLSKTRAVYLSGNKTRDNIPSHLIVRDNLPASVQSFYEKLCPAGVYEKKDRFIVNASNCIDCKATDVLGPKWTPRERGSGPNYKLM